MIVVIRARSSTSNDGQVRVCPGTCRPLSVALPIAEEPSAWLEVKRAWTLGLFFCEVSLFSVRLQMEGLLKFDGAS